MGFFLQHIVSPTPRSYYGFSTVSLYISVNIESTTVILCSSRLIKYLHILAGSQWDN